MSGLPKLCDRKTVAEEMGVSRAVVDVIFDALPVVVLPGSRKPLVRRADLERLLVERTFPPGVPRP